METDKVAIIQVSGESRYVGSGKVVLVSKIMFQLALDLKRRVYSSESLKLLRTN